MDMAASHSLPPKDPIENEFDNGALARIEAAPTTDLVNDPRSSQQVFDQLKEVHRLFRLARITAAVPGDEPRDRGIAIEQLHYLATHGAEPVRFRIINQLGASPIDELVAAAFDRLRSDSSPLVRHEAAFALGRVGTQEAYQALIGSLSDESWLVRHEAAMGLVDSSYAPALERLEECLSDSSPEVVSSCQVAISSIRYSLGMC